MYKIEFLEYNSLMQQVMSQEDTLQNIIDLSLNGKPSKEEKKHLKDAEIWAKYAFEKDDIYNMVFYNEDKLYASIRITDMSISIDFLEKVNTQIIKGLTLVYHRFDMHEYFENNKKVYYQNKDLFLGQMGSWDKSGSESTLTEVVFGVNNRASVTLTISRSKDNDSKTVSQGIDLNTSNNYIRSPKNYKDFEYLLNYKENINPEYFDLPIINEEDKLKTKNDKTPTKDDKQNRPPDTFSVFDNCD